MSGNRLRVVTTLVVLVVTLLALLPMSAVEAEEARVPMGQAGGVNLVVNPGFEGIGKPVDNALPNYDNWTRSTFNGVAYGEIFTPDGWVTWWQEGDFKRPECKVIPNEAPFNSTPSRIHQGYYSGMCFTFFGKQNAGYYQVVRNIPAGSVVQGSFYAHSWSCGEDDPPLSCGDPDGFYFRVGIDPNGGTDPFSGSIVWSGAAFHPDKYGYVGPVQATVGEAGAATLFIQAYGKWPNKHNDAYFDNPALSIIGATETATPTPPPPPPTEEAPEVPPTLAVTPTARGDGAIVHTVVAGDTLFGLALTYGVDVQQIYDLNGLDSSSLLSIGQEIVISSTGAAAATPTPAATPEVAETPLAVEPTPAQANPGTTIGDLPAAPAQGKGAVCVSAFFDANGDMFRQDDGSEMLLPNAQVSLLARSGPVDSRTTDGISEPWCFNDLEPGNFIIRHTAPPGYILTDGGQWNFTLDAGEVESIELAYTREAGAAPEEPAPGPDEEVAPIEEPEDDEGGVTNALNIILRVAGFIVLALAIAVAVLFVLSRRSA